MTLKIKKGMPEISKLEISEHLTKSEVIALRVTPAEKDAIKTAASKLGLTVTDYLVRVGMATAAKLN